MININNYIVEKLKIDKNIKLKNTYNDGDNCLLIWVNPSRDNWYLSIVCIKIISITDNDIRFNYYVKSGNNESSNLKLDTAQNYFWEGYKFNNEYIYYESNRYMNKSVGIIMSANMGIDALNEIMNSADYQLCLFKYIKPLSKLDIFKDKTDNKFDVLDFDGDYLTDVKLGKLQNILKSNE